MVTWDLLFWTERSYRVRSALAGIIRAATAALAADSAAQINIMIRNPNTNAWEIDV